MQTTATNRTDSNGRERIEALVTSEQKELLEQAAVRRGLPLADFISQSLEWLAAETVRDSDVIALSPRDSLLVADALLNPPEPTPAFREGLRRYGRVTGLVKTGDDDEELGS